LPLDGIDDLIEPFGRGARKLAHILPDGCRARPKPSLPPAYGCDDATHLSE
jgi:hypothetical protein